MAHGCRALETHEDHDHRIGQNAPALCRWVSATGGAYPIGANLSDGRAPAFWGRGLPARNEAGNVKKGGLLGDQCNTPIRTRQRLADL